MNPSTDFMFKGFICAVLVEQHLLKTQNRCWNGDILNMYVSNDIFNCWKGFSKCMKHTCKSKIVHGDISTILHLNGVHSLEL